MLVRKLNSHKAYVARYIAITERNIRRNIIIPITVLIIVTNQYQLLKKNKYGSEAAHSLADTPLTDPKSFLYAIIRFSLKEAYPHKFFQ